ncbi:MAG TPA: tRNA (adenosine(37)-N6)-threonylcarbamoyltransferase complex ATPase subunit type 1 TsaE [Candidatus Wallbacteria bacterium]|nr:MAG: tRNA threonylcarbamoyladenosine biosynthesis protein TsaE [bacterium ADurb.Bin243]HOD38957.1 tRNA (adenosine(37)-N6)-threonylcarbamoyltransferase complex ATPase subunit type 1 TsaE [Candidatus Wallbacteria bacterium]HPG56729.1 tRNA (adenosine(37)-N6)-threonylcarbamoyltransferase complex ATPase subunit type 1 TsaE [Candidatus Wallbacteria bacterium]
MIVKTKSFEQTHRLGERFGKNICGNKYSKKFIFALDGGLGSGKTAFVSGLARGLGIDGPVLSPSFTIVKEYSGDSYPLYHMDLYRLSDTHDLMSFDFYEYVSSEEFVTAIEWAGKFGDMNYLPEIPAIFCVISPDNHGDENSRIFKFRFANMNDKLKKEIAAVD